MPAVAAADGVHPWVVPPPRLNKSAYFSNLSDGASIETPFLLKFGLTGIGIAPIVKPVKGTGHHHLLVNRDLPMDPIFPGFVVETPDGVMLVQVVGVVLGFRNG